MDAVKLGNAIKTLRRNRGFTQQELADLLGVTDKAVSKWERGIGAPDISMVARLASVLNTDADNLLDGNASYLEKNWSGLLILDEETVMTTVFGKPSVYFPLCYFLLAGIQRIRICCNEACGEYLRRTLGDGTQLHLELSFAAPESCSGVKIANTMVIFGTPFLYGSNLTRGFQRAISSKKKMSVLCLPSYREEDSKISFDSAGTAQQPDACLTDVYVGKQLPFYFIRDEITIEKLDRAQFAALLEKKTESRQLYVEPLGRGIIYSDLRTEESVLDTALLIRTIERFSGEKVYAIEEIVKNRRLR